MTRRIEAPIDTVFEVATDVALEVRCEARSIAAKPMSPLGNLMFKKMMRQCMEDDLDDLKQAAEARVT